MELRLPVSKRCFLRLLLICLCGAAFGRPSWGEYLAKPDDWFQSEGGKQILDNILSWQDENGIWPKNEEIDAGPFTGDRKALRGTFDNKATTDEMRMLAHGYRAVGDERYKAAFLKGLDLILKAQYANGGWPQYYPLRKGYYSHITFNDGAMVRLMKLMKEITGGSDYAFVDSGRQARVKAAFDNGLKCILDCQIRVNGKLTVWCAQHDENDLSPAAARSYELASLSGGESAGILRLLMRLEDPSPRVVEAIEAGVAWYQESHVEGIRIQSVNGKMTAVADPNAPWLWGRFYDLKTNKPIFCDRDGIAKYNFNEIDQERSTGYDWYGEWGKDVFRDYEKWKIRWAAPGG